MPNMDSVEIIFLMDRSGSMMSMRQDAIGGFNAFLEEQQKTNGDAKLTYVQFDHEYTPVFASKPIQEVEPLTSATYQPRGSTALLDATGRAINEAGSRFDALPEDEKPGKVVFAVMTDGFENASKEFTNAQVKEMIKRQEKCWGWSFAYLSSSPTAKKDACMMGFAPSGAVQIHASTSGTRAAYRAFSSHVSSVSKGDEVQCLSATYDDAYSEEEVKTDSATR